MKQDYIPKRKDIIYVNLNPVYGCEQGGVRPALVISNYNYNKVTNTCIVIPISSTKKDFYLHYKLNNRVVHGSLCIEHIRSIDYKKRYIKYIGMINDLEYKNINSMIDSLWR